jgi:hypothetical protein
MEIMMKKVIVIASAITAVVAMHSVAYADGPVSAYDGEEDLALSPNEALVNDDGAAEDPQHKMTPTARIFRNGFINGRAYQKKQDANVSPPPLPPAGYSTLPQAAQVQSIPPQPPQPVAQEPVRQYAPPPPQYQPQYRQPPVVVNVVQPAPRYYPQQYPYAPPEQQAYSGDEVMPAQAYAPPPIYVMPRPVYVSRQPVIPPAYLPPSYYGRPYVQAYAPPYGW